MSRRASSSARDGGDHTGAAAAFFGETIQSSRQKKIMEAIFHTVASKMTAQDLVSKLDGVLENLRQLSIVVYDYQRESGTTLARKMYA